ncbi:MAG TPA: hypothetical protein PK157_22810, partial [Bryobacteraceae bacterium]|nr:hypothetical protein [Bryobacteraceae bacterium]
EVVVGREELDVGEVLGRLEDAGDLEARRGGVVKRGGRGAAREAPVRRGSKRRRGSAGMIRYPYKFGKRYT